MPKAQYRIYNMGSTWLKVDACVDLFPPPLYIIALFYYYLSFTVKNYCLLKTLLVIASIALQQKLQADR